MKLEIYTVIDDELVRTIDVVHVRIHHDEILYVFGTPEDPQVGSFWLSRETFYQIQE